MRACNYNAPTGDSRLAIKTLLLNLPWWWRRRRRRLRTPSPSPGLSSAPLCFSAARWFTAAFFLFLYEDRDVSKDSGVVFVSIAPLRQPGLLPHFCQSSNETGSVSVFRLIIRSWSLLLFIYQLVSHSLLEKMPFNTV